MNECIRHRGPDSDGFYASGNSTSSGCVVGLAIRRLAIIDVAGGHSR